MRILGIDLGSTSIKLVEVDSAFGRYEIHDYHEIPITTDTLALEALSQFIKQLPKKPDRMISCLKTRQTTLRNLILPTKDRKSIQSAVGFELEDEIPVSLENSFYDYSILNQSKSGTELHIAATLKATIQSEIQHWHTAGVEPDYFTTEAWAYRTYLNRVLSPNDKQHPILLAHLGHERSVLYVHWRGKPILCHELNWGGANLTKAICVRYQIPIEQAEQAKLDHGFVIYTQDHKNLTPEQIEFSNTLLTPIQNLITEIRQINLATKAICEERIHQIHITGGTALLPGLLQTLSEGTNLPVHLSKGISSAAPSGITYAETADAKFLLPTALALSIVGQDRNAVINFRKGVFAKIGGAARELNWKILRRPLIAASIVFVSLYSSLFIQSMVYKSRLKSIDTKLEQTIRRFFGVVSNSQIKNYIKNPKSLKVNVDKELAKTRHLSKLLTPNSHSPVNYLKTLSSTISKNTIVDLTVFQIGAAPKSSYLNNDPQNVSLSFVFSNPQTADALTGLLEKKFKPFNKSSVEETTLKDGAGKKWKLTLSGTPTEDMYGN